MSPIPKYIADNPHLTLHPLKAGTEAWLKFRKRGIGGSDMSTILGLNPWKSSLEMYYERISPIDPDFIVNEATFHGINLEPYVRKLWSYWSGTKEGYMENYNAGRKVRSYDRLDGIITNSNYPWMFINTDALIPTGSVRLDNGEEMKCPGVLECKTISYNAMSQWKGGLPPGYAAQVHEYMVVLEVDYAEIAVLKDGRYFDVLPIPFNERLGDIVIEQSRKYWEEHVLPGREARVLMDQYSADGKYELVNRQQGLIHRYEPPPDNSMAYQDYLKNNRETTPEREIEGTEAMFKLAERHKEVALMKKKLDGYSTGLYNQIAKHMVDDSAEIMSFGRRGKITFKKNKKDVTILRNSIEHVPDYEKLNRQFKAMNLDGKGS